MDIQKLLDKGWTVKYLPKGVQFTEPIFNTQKVYIYTRPNKVYEFIEDAGTEVFAPLIPLVDGLSLEQLVNDFELTCKKLFGVEIRLRNKNLMAIDGLRVGIMSLEKD